MITFPHEISNKFCFIGRQHLKIWVIIVAPTFPLSTFSVLGSRTHQVDSRKTGLLVTELVLLIQRFPRSYNKISKENTFVLEVYLLESSPAVPGPATGSPIPIQADWELLPSGEARNGAQGIAGTGVELIFFTESWPGSICQQSWCSWTESWQRI